MPKAIKKKVPKKTETPEQEVQEKLSDLKGTLSKRRRTVLAVGAAILVVVLALAGFLFYSYNRGLEATRLEVQGYNVYHSRASQAQEDKASRYRNALGIFSKAYATKKSPFSLYYIAACHFELGEYDEAMKTLKEFARRYSGDEEFLPLAYRKMAAIAMKKGDPGEAKKALEAMSRLKTDVFKDFALIEYGRLLEKEGNAEEARKKYEELVAKFPSSPYRDEAELKLSAKKAG